MTEEKLKKAQQLQEQIKYLDRLLEEVDFSLSPIRRVNPQEIKITGVYIEAGEKNSLSRDIIFPEWKMNKLPVGGGRKEDPIEFKKNRDLLDQISFIQAKAVSSFTHIMYEHLIALRGDLVEEFEAL